MFDCKPAMEKAARDCESAEEVKQGPLIMTMPNMRLQCVFLIFLSEDSTDGDIIRSEYHKDLSQKREIISRRLRKLTYLFSILLAVNIVVLAGMAPAIDWKDPVVSGSLFPFWCLLWIPFSFCTSQVLFGPYLRRFVESDRVYLAPYPFCAHAIPRCLLGVLCLFVSGTAGGLGLALGMASMEKNRSIEGGYVFGVIFTGIGIGKLLALLQFFLLAEVISPLQVLAYKMSELDSSNHTDQNTTISAQSVQ
jgi:hypothetical protein